MSHQDPFAANLAEQGAALREQMAHRTALPEDTGSEHLNEDDAADRKAAILQMKEMSLKMKELMEKFNVQGDEVELPAAAKTASASAAASPPGFEESSQAAPTPVPAPVPVLTESVSRVAGPCQAPTVAEVQLQSPSEMPAVASATAETPVPPGAGSENAVIRELKSEIAEVMNLVRMQAAQMQVQTAQLQALSSVQAPKPAGQGAPAPIDKKVIDRPGKYSGDVRHYIEWSEKFVKFLARQDPR